MDKIGQVKAEPTTPTTDSITDSNTEVKPEQIKLVVADQKGAEIHFKVKKTIRIEKVLLSFCERQGYDRTKVQFLLPEGGYFTGDKSVGEYELEDGDVIQCVIKQDGGSY